jgi:hypothetical protein
MRWRSSRPSAPTRYGRSHVSRVASSALSERSGHGDTIANTLDWPPNLWVGVSVESARYRFVSTISDRFPPPFVSCRVSRCSTDFRPRRHSINWVIPGGESGTAARPMQLDWVSDLKNQCVDVGIPFSSSSGEVAPPKPADGCSRAASGTTCPSWHRSANTSPANAGAALGRAKANRCGDPRLTADPRMGRCLVRSG